MALLVELKKLMKKVQILEFCSNINPRNDKTHSAKWVWSESVSRPTGQQFGY